jgi:hypothetical protein
MSATRLPVGPAQQRGTGGVATIQTPAPTLGKTRRRVLDTSTADLKTISSRNPHPPPYTSPISDSDSDLNSDCDSCSYSDPDTEPDTDTEADIGPDASLDLGANTDLDSEAEEILKDIAHYTEEGPAKPNHVPYTKKLWKREGEFWEK